MDLSRHLVDSCNGKISRFKFRSKSTGQMLGHVSARVQKLPIVRIHYKTQLVDKFEAQGPKKLAGISGD